MSFQQRNSRHLEKPGLGYGHSMAQMPPKPFSIRNYVSMSRQKSIEQSWPFPKKYLKLCLNDGISNILPALDSGLNEKEDYDFGEIPDASSLEDTIHLLCGKLGRLSLSFDGDPFGGNELQLATTLDAQEITGHNIKSSKASDTLHKNLCVDRRKRKGKRKKSLAEILAVAKHCILDGNNRIYVSGCGSSRSPTQNADEQRKRKVKVGMLRGLNSRPPDQPKQDFPLLKKHRRCNDSVTGIGQFNKRSCTMGMIDYKKDGCKLKSWSRKMNSCKSAAETEKKPGGYKRKAREICVSVTAVGLQDHHAY